MRPIYDYQGWRNLWFIKALEVKLIAVEIVESGQCKT